MNELVIYAIVFLGGLVIGTAVTIIITRIYKPYYKQDILSISGEIQKNLAALLILPCKLRCSTLLTYQNRLSPSIRS